MQDLKIGRIQLPTNRISVPVETLKGGIGVKIFEFGKVSESLGLLIAVFIIVSHKISQTPENKTALSKHQPDNQPDTGGCN